MDTTQRTRSNLTLIAIGFAAVIHCVESLSWLLRPDPYVPTKLAVAAGEAMSPDGRGIKPEALAPDAAWTLWGTSILTTVIGLLVCWMLYIVASNALSGRLLAESTVRAARHVSNLMLVWIIVDFVGVTMGNNWVLNNLGLSRDIPSYDLTRCVWGYLLWALLFIFRVALSRARAAEDELEGII